VVTGPGPPDPGAFAIETGLPIEETPGGNGRGHRNMQEPRAQDRPVGGPQPSRLVAEVVQAVVAMVAPEEAASFDELCTAFFNDPGRALHPGGRPAGPLDYGIPEAHGLITPIVIATVSGLVSQAVREGISRASRRGLRSWRARKHRIDGPAVLRQPLPPVPAETAARAAQVGKRLALDAHIDVAKADEISIAVRVVLTGGEVGGAPPQP
jgi:hypothetical protein